MELKKLSIVITFDYFMYLVSIMGVIEHVVAIICYFWLHKTIFGFSIMAGNWKVVGECFGILLSLLLFVGVWKKYPIPVLIYWFGIMTYFLLHIMYYLPYVKLLSIGLKFKQLKSVLIPGIITTFVILFNAGCALVFLALHLKQWRAEALAKKVKSKEDVEKAQGQEGRAPDPYSYVNSEFESIEL